MPIGDRLAPGGIPQEIDRAYVQIRFLREARSSKNVRARNISPMIMALPYPPHRSSFPKWQIE